MTKKTWLFGIILLVYCIAYSQQKTIQEKSKTQNGENSIKKETGTAMGPYSDDSDPEWFRKMDYEKWLKNMERAIKYGNQSEWVDHVDRQLMVRKAVTEVKQNIESKNACFSCKFGINLARKMMEANKSDEEILDRATVLCSTFKFGTPRVCEGILKLVGADVVNVVRYSDMKPAQLCTFFLGESCLNGYDPRHDWKISIRPAQKHVRHPTSPPSEAVPKLKIIQISDTHYDPYYVEGSNADCNEPLCCRITDGLPENPSKAAGKWGDYRKCDLPLVLFENALKHIADRHKDVDAIYWTGDIPPHDVWNQTREENLANLRFSAALMRKYFKGIPIYPSIGNHESCPVDSYPPPFAPAKKQMSWLFDEVAKEWARWLPEDTLKTIRKGAFYSTLIKPGFRVISINGNYCSKQNYYLAWNSTDPVGQLAWLLDELEAAEKKGEKVHIIGHIPPGNIDCLKSWSATFYDIINRFESTVMAQFYGHTHFDEFEVFYDTKDYKRPVGVGYIAPSLTPWENVNPAYRIYYVEGDHSKTNRAIVDHETWKLNLDEANSNDYPVWYKAYSARQAYKMKSLLPKDWDNLITRMSNDTNLFDTYYKNYYRNSPVRPACDAECKSRLLCDLRSGKSFERSNLCKNLS